MLHDTLKSFVSGYTGATMRIPDPLLFLYEKAARFRFRV